MSCECANLREEREAEMVEPARGPIGPGNKRREEVERKLGNLIGKILLTLKKEAGVEVWGWGRGDPPVGRHKRREKPVVESKKCLGKDS